MGDDDVDLELLQLLRDSLGMSSAPQDGISSNTGVLKDAEYIYNNAIDVAIGMHGTKAASAHVYQAMQEQEYSTSAWSEQVLHPKSSEGFSDVDTVNFVFTMDLLNFSFWSDQSESERFQVDYRGRRWTGYQSLLACLRRALDEGVTITTPRYWRSSQATDDALRQVFRSATHEDMPLLNERIAILREAAGVLHDSFGDPNDTCRTLDVDIGDPADEREPAHTGAGVVDTAGLVTAAIVEKLEPDAATINAVPSSVPAEQEHAAADTSNLSPAGQEPAKPPSTVSDEAHNTDQQPSLDTHDGVAREGAMVAEAATVAGCTPQEPPQPDMTVTRLIEQADHLAGKLVNLLAKHFSCFRDETRFDGRKVRLLKRAQIFVADLWAAFDGTGYGEFHDIGHLTMFADYRVPQMLHSLGVLSYSPPLQYRITDRKEIPSGHSWEVQLRGCSIWAVELMRREIISQHPEAEGTVNAVLIDFFLYDLAKECEVGSGGTLVMPHHRTRNIWY
ncbi:hypothetical protein LTR53_004536 [Teratosphaeriaceae sp. CCFEE 6253]|nr:hypothetical protein LTR53_004536 [Teratosphaeriaceae sp. CCFEE 6253]